MSFIIQAQKAIDAVLAKIFGDDFKRFDMCAEGFQKTFGPYHVTFFNYVIPIPLGPFILYFGTCFKLLI